MSALPGKLADGLAKWRGREPYVPWGEIWGRFGLFRPLHNLRESWAKRHPAPIVRREGDWLRVEKGPWRVYWPREYDLQPLFAVWKETLPGHPHDYFQFYEPRPGDVVFDVGACEGFFGLRVAERGGRVRLFEPAPRLAEALSRTFAPWIASGAARVERLALGDAPGTCDFEVRDGSAVSGQLRDNRGSAREESEGTDRGSRFTVTVETLDRFVRDRRIDRLDLVKMDVEGAEFRVLHGAGRTLRDLRPDLLICTYHAPEDYRRAEEELVPLGYRLRHSRVVHIRHGERPHYRYALVHASCR